MSEATVIDGKAAAADVVENVRLGVERLVADGGVRPGLAVVLVGDDPASAVYVRNKGKTADKVGFASQQIDMPADAPEADLVAVVERLNADPAVHGILVQLPLPKHMDEKKILNLIDPDKDVDGFHPINVGRLGAGDLDAALVPCTPAGSLYLIERTLGADLSGKTAVIVGRSNIVGKPMAQLLLSRNCTVTIAHSRTQNIDAVTRGADILVAAVGRPEMVKGAWIKPGATVIDVGINRIPAPEKGDGKTKLVGDVDYAEAAAVAGAVTPVPGGVGPMTIAFLMRNTLTAAQRLQGR